jgi:hypothetical protein
VLPELGQGGDRTEQAAGESVETAIPPELPARTLSMIAPNTGRFIVPPETFSSCGSMTTWTPLRSDQDLIACS